MNESLEIQVMNHLSTSVRLCASALMLTDLFLSQLMVPHTPTCLGTLVNYPPMTNHRSTLPERHSRWQL